MKYVFIERERTHHALSTLCRVLGVSRSGYHGWLAARENGPRRRHERRAEIDRLVREMFEAKRQRYGAPRLTCALRRAGHALNRKSVAASLARQGLRARARRRFRATTNSRHSLPVFPDRLGQDFSASVPNEKWVQDIVRHEALSTRAAVGDRRGPVVAATGYKLRAVRTGERR